MRSRKLKIWAAALAAFALTLSMVGGVYAYLKNSAEDSVENTFTPDTETDPSFSQSAVDVGTLDYAVYVRAVIVVTWQKTVEGAVHVYGQMPVKGTDYTIGINTAKWFEVGGFYYYRERVDSKEPNVAVLTEALIASVEEKLDANKPAGYELHVEIIAQTIQAVGGTDVDDTPAVTDAWGISVDSDGKLVDPNP